MNFATFNKFRDIIYEKSGIHLTENKQSLLYARLGKRMRELKIDDHRAYLEFLMADQTGEELVHMIDFVSTNVTSFFRESQHFEILSDLMKEWLSSGQKRFRLWSAACSSGEEPYSIAMTMSEATKGITGIDTKILATDISTRILERAQFGIYQAEDVKPIRMDMRNQYFQRLNESNGNSYKVKQKLANMVVFKRINLSLPPFPMHGPFDAIFCRNVMIYFDNLVRRRLLHEMDRLLKKGGYLFIGHAESLTNITGNSLRSMRPSVYIKY